MMVFGNQIRFINKFGPSFFGFSLKKKFNHVNAEVGGDQDCDA